MAEVSFGYLLALHLSNLWDTRSWDGELQHHSLYRNGRQRVGFWKLPSSLVSHEREPDLDLGNGAVEDNCTGLTDLLTSCGAPTVNTSLPCLKRAACFQEQVGVAPPVVISDVAGY